MNHDDPTQRIQPRPPATAMPGPLDLTQSAPTQSAGGPAKSADETAVLRLDELFDAEPQPAATAPAPPTAAAPPASAAADAPTWTAMPVVTVDSAAPAATPPAATPPAATPPVASTAAPAPQQPARRHEAVDRVRADARAAWDGALRRGRAWFGVEDNALVALTAVVGIMLILVVAALSG